MTMGILDQSPDIDEAHAIPELYYGYVHYNFDPEKR